MPRTRINLCWYNLRVFILGAKKVTALMINPLVPWASIHPVHLNWEENLLIEVNRLCLSNHQRKEWMKAIRNPQSEHCTFVFTGLVKELWAVIHPGSDQKYRNAFIMVNYIGREARGFLWVLAYGWQIYCRDTEQPTMAHGPGDITNTGDLGIFSLHCILLQDSCDGWMWLLLVGATVLNANCFEGHRIHWLLW